MDRESSGESWHCLPGDRGAVGIVAVGYLDGGGPHGCGCGAKLYPQTTPLPAISAWTTPTVDAATGPADWVWVGLDPA
jgi:hypothetical protein